MNRPISLRLAAFALAIVLVVGLTGWAIQASWQKLDQFRDQIKQLQLSSFQDADQFRSYLQALDKSLLLYQVKQDPSYKERFHNDWANLNDWIDVQRSNAQQVATWSPNAFDILSQIDTAFDQYHLVATKFLDQVDSKTVEPTLANFERVESESRHLCDLGYALVVALRDARTQIVSHSSASVGYFRGMIFASLTLLLILVCWLAVVVYGNLIAPLRVKLVQSQHLVERHEKLASLGMLAAGVAHEIRNPLTAIKAWLFMHQKHLKPGTPEYADAEIIGKEINRLEKIVRDFLQFARPSEPERVTLPAEQSLGEVFELMRPQLEKCNIRLELGELDGSEIRVDPAQIKQVLINLVQNAADAISQNGTITLRARRQSKYLNGRLVDAVILEVADTGKGIPPEVEKRLFDPFFTTKDGGTGLGLSIAARIVEKHGGILLYQTQVNRGTTFGVVLPRA